MILCDVNVLVYAFQTDLDRHDDYRKWLEDVVTADSAFGLSELVLSSFLRIVTHPRIFSPPTPLTAGLEFVTALREQPNAVIISPGERHWQIFTHLCENVEAKGNLIQDAYLAALAIESGSEWITTDRDYTRFPGLNMRHPLQSR